MIPDLRRICFHVLLMLVVALLTDASSVSSRAASPSLKAVTSCAVVLCRQGTICKEVNGQAVCVPIRPSPEPCICTLEFNPVCCKTYTGLITASNPCQCKCKGGTVVSSGPCEDTSPCACTREYRPVCCKSKDNYIFKASNPCLCKCEGRIISSHRCERCENVSCFAPCTACAIFKEAVTCRKVLGCETGTTS